MPTWFTGNGSTCSTSTGHMPQLETPDRVIGVIAAELGTPLDAEGSGRRDG